MELYKKIKGYNLVKEGCHFGLSNTLGKPLLPTEYDSIFYTGVGFIITRESKSGYISFYEGESARDGGGESGTLPEGRVKAFLPCVYDRIEPTRNGLVLYSMTDDPLYTEKKAWFDFKSGELYENLCFMRNHREFDEFLNIDESSHMPLLKRAGEEFYAIMPFGLPISILYEIPIYDGTVRYFLCCEELSEDETECRLGGYEYFFMIILPDSYTFTEPKGSIKEALGDFPRVIAVWERRAEAEAEQKRRLRGGRK